MNDFKNMDFLERFPPALKKDEKMLALGKLIAEELHITANLIEKNIIYANIDNLSEQWLDVLAYDLHVDWYDYDYPIEIKRNVLKDSVKIHQKLGTKYAIETALKNVYETAKVEEWFEYGGKPYWFRVRVGLGKNGLDEYTARKMKENMEFYKNLRSHCEKVIYHFEAERAIVRVKSFIKMSAMIKVKAYIETELKSTNSKTKAISRLQLTGTMKIKSRIETKLKSINNRTKATSRLQFAGKMKIKAIQ